MNIHLPRLYAELVADLILKSDRSYNGRLPRLGTSGQFRRGCRKHDPTGKIDCSLWASSVRYDGGNSGMIESVDVTPEVALSLAYFMESYKRVANESFTRRFRI
ncbi:hypothetical protein ALHIDCOG_00420 [Klebsiella phage CPRSB]|nr:hypothetical protein ALHIDCOG_00420 [Klebsiella phage CPRSB]